MIQIDRDHSQLRPRRSAASLLAAAIALSALAPSALLASAPRTDKTGQPQTTADPDATTVNDEDLSGATLPAHTTAAQRTDSAWSLLTDAAGDEKHPQTRIQALAALGMLRGPRAEKLIEAGMKDPDLDVRTAAALAAGQSVNRNLTTPLRNMLDDPEPQVALTAAITLWKMNDRSGEDILMAVADGERSANASLMHGTRHKIDSDLHDPGKLARLGAMQGATMMLGPFGFGIAAFNFIHQSGGDLARADAIEHLAAEHTPPVHTELIAALGDKDPVVRAAAAKGLVDYRDKATSTALYALFVDPKQPVRLTSAAAYLRTTGVPGPRVEIMTRNSVSRRNR